MARILKGKEENPKDNWNLNIPGTSLLGQGESDTEHKKGARGGVGVVKI